MGGLMAARVLSEYVDRVTVIEKDRYPAFGKNRKGVPQGHHLHGILARGLQVMEEFFPGLEAELIRAGAQAGDLVGDFRWYQHGCPKAKFESGLRGVLLTRPLLEGTVRNRVRRLPNVTVLEGCAVQGLLATPDHSQVTGVHYTHSGDQFGSRLEADLVVDATGRGSRTPRWLKALGYTPPVEDTITIKLGYATRSYRRHPSDLDGDIGVSISAIPPDELHAGAMIAVEKDRWMVMLGGMLGDHPPTDEDGYLAFAKGLVQPDIYDIIKQAEPLSDVAVYTFPANMRRRYERLDRFPGRFLILGDAYCSFNPIYGQGMTVAALEADVLQRLLNEQGPLSDGLAGQYMQQASQLIDVPWKLAAGADLSFTGVEGPGATTSKAMGWYMSRLHRAAAYDQEVCRTFFEVVNLLRSPAALFQPSMIWRVLRGGLSASPTSDRSPVPAMAEPAPMRNA